MDLRSGFLTITVLLVLFAVLLVRNGLRQLQAAHKLTFYRLRRARISAALWAFGGALALIALAVLLPTVGLQAVFEIYPPTPTLAPTLTPSLTPTITLSPTITLTPTITDTPLYTDTPTITPTPFLPLVVEVQFSSIVTPNPKAVISPLVFSTQVERGLPKNPSTVFRNPIARIYATFSYDNMTPGAQWSAIWYRNGEYVYHETYPWNGSTGGYYYSECASPAGGWLPGVYTVHIFVGLTFKQGGSFTVEGVPPLTPTPTITHTPTLTPSATPTP